MARTAVAAGRPEEVQIWCDKVLADDYLGGSLYAEACYSLACMAEQQGDLPAAFVWLDRGAAYEASVPRVASMIHFLRGVLLQRQSDHERGHQELRRALELVENRAHATVRRAHLQMNLAMWPYSNGVLEEGRELMEKAIAGFRAGGATHLLGMALGNRAMLEETAKPGGDHLQDYAEATALLATAKHYQVWIKANHAVALGWAGQVADADVLAQEAYALALELNLPRYRHQAVWALGVVAVQRGQAEQAIALLQQEGNPDSELGPKMQLALAEALLAAGRRSEAERIVAAIDVVGAGRAVEAWVEQEGARLLGPTRPP